MGLVGIGDSEGSVSIPSDISNTSIALKARKERVPYVLWSSILTFLVDHQCTLNYWVHLLKGPCRRLVTIVKRD